MTVKPVHVIGGGLAGSEAAWQIAQAGVPVVLHEMRRAGVKTDAHHTDGLAELVCSNSFRSDDAANNAVAQVEIRARRKTGEETIHVDVATVRRAGAGPRRFRAAGSSGPAARRR